MGKWFTRIVEKLKGMMREILGFLLEDEETEPESNKLEREIEEERMACARMLAAASRAEEEARELERRRSEIHQSAINALDQGDEQKALRYLDEEEHVKKLVEEALERYKSLDREATQGLAAFKEMTREASELKTRKEERDQEIKDRSLTETEKQNGDLDQAIQDMREKAEEQDRERIMMKARAEVDEFLATARRDYSDMSLTDEGDLLLQNLKLESDGAKKDDYASRVRKILTGKGS
jgi:phage shock protein A